MDLEAWLLDEAEPLARAQALVDLRGLAPDDKEVLAARREGGKRGAGARLLEGVSLAEEKELLYRPKYGAAWHRVVALAEMGMTRDEPRFDEAMAWLLDRFATPDGAFGNRDAGHLCLAGNMARAALLAGYGDDPRVEAALDWLVGQQLPDGGWTCWPDRAPGSLDGWEALAAFAAVPLARRSAAMRQAIARGVEFYLERGLGLDDGYAPWRRIHFPRHYFYDLLAGLEIVTALGDPKDPRLEPAVAWLLAKRRADGAWALDADHPDHGEGYVPDKTGRPVTPLVAERAGEPSRFATLAALRVLQRVGR